MKFVAKKYPTIMSGLVIRWKLRRDDGEALWVNEPQISASREGVMFQGAWPALTYEERPIVESVMAEAFAIYTELAMDRGLQHEHRDAVESRYPEDR